MSDGTKLAQDIARKSTRDIAVVSLTLIDSHLAECAARWKTIYRILIAIGCGVGLQLTSRIFDLFQHVTFTHG